MDAKMGMFFTSMMKGKAAKEQQEREAKERASANKLKDQLIKMQIQNAKIKQIEAAQAAKDAEMIRPYKQKAFETYFGGQAQGQPQQGMGQVGTVMESGAFNDKFSADSFPQPGVADQMAASQMPPEALAIISKELGYDFLGAGRLNEQQASRQQRKDIADRSFGETQSMNTFNKNLQTKKYEGEGSFQEVWNPETRTMDKVWVPKYSGLTMNGKPVLKGKPPATTRVTNLTSGQRDTISFMDDAIEIVDKVISGTKPEFVGISGMKKTVGNKLSGVLPKLGSPEYGAWKMVYNRFQALDRNKLFGASLTDSEKTAYKDAVASASEGYDVFMAKAAAFLETLKNKRNNYIDRAITPTSDIKTGGSIPTDALGLLSEGKIITFANGQSWTLANGEPKRVK